MSSSSSSANKMPNFAIGQAAKREVKRALLRSTNPAETIKNYQKTRSLHSMISKAFNTKPQSGSNSNLANTTPKNKDNNDNNSEGTTPTPTNSSGRPRRAAAAAAAAATSPKRRKDDDDNDENKKEESLDTDSVMTFLSHLGVSQYEVHKRVSDALQKSLEEEIRTLRNNHDALVYLLKSCWHQATTVAELRPVLWAVLKQLGPDTPPAVLSALAEQTEDGSLKHPEIFKALPPLLKRLVWEADWNDKVSIEKERELTEAPKQYLKLVRSTLFHETVNPLIVKYCSTEALVESAGKFFVSSSLERRVITTQRRALALTTSGSTAGTTSNTTTTSAAALLGKSSGGGGTGTTTAAAASSSSSEPYASSAKAVSQLRGLLGETAGSGNNAYRPKLLNAFLKILMAMHGAVGSSTHSLTGINLHCTLLSDILLSSGGPLPLHYAHVHTLARLLDDAVKNGVLSDDDISKVQDTLKLVYAVEQAEDDGDEDDDGKQNGDKSNKKKSKDDGKNDDGGGEGDDGNKKNKKGKPQQASTFLKRQLNRIVTAGLTAMKESDPQSLFLNPVTDAIAPGYSKVIKKPMCISTMESKIENNVYNTIAEWDTDVRLMFKNCVDYNRGQAGQWFRGEANRQLKVYRDEILPQAKKLYQVELQRRKAPEEPFGKRKREDESSKDKKPKISPLEPAFKRRKVDPQHESMLSLPALASMLLADPFVVRLMLDRVLRSLRIDVLKGSTVPSAHNVIPSILQLLNLAEWSTKICAIRGQTYVIPDSGLSAPKDEKRTSPETLVPYTSLRRFMPIFISLVLEADLDKRVEVGGDLNTVAELERPPRPEIVVEKGTPPMQAAVSLLEGIFVHLCTTGGFSRNASLSVTFKKLAAALQQMTGNVLEEKAFFVCLLPAILRQKARLNLTVRDTIISTWMDWLRTTRKKKKLGSMTSAAHEYLVLLLNEWASFGNLLMPRDLLLKVATEIIEVVNESEPTAERKFDALWKLKDDADSDFEPIRKNYEQLLNALPESHRAELKQAAGIDSEEAEEPKDDNDEAMEDAMEKEEETEPVSMEEG